MSAETVDGFGAPVHTSQRKGFPEALKDGVQEHRVLPPILSQTETGKYVQEHTCHYGYGTKMNNSDKEVPNPFYCVEEGKFVAGKFVVLQSCPECERIKQVKSQKAIIESDMKKAGNSDSDIKAATKSLDDWLRKHNRDFKYYVNVKDAAGRFFTAKYPSKDVWKVIKGHIEKYKAQRIPIDAIAASQGLMFRITRSGKGINTDYSVEVVTEEVIINGQAVEGASKPKLAPLTREDAKKARENCLDLSDVGIIRLAREDVARLVASNGDPNVIATIFARGEKVEPASSRPEPEDERSPEPEPSAPNSTPAEKAAQGGFAAAMGIAPERVEVTDTRKAAAAPQAAPVTAAPSAAMSQADLLAQARALVEKARAMGAAPTAVQPAATQTVAVAAVPVAAVQEAPPKPAPAAPKAEVKVAPAPAVRQPQAAPAGVSEVEASFLDQFNLPS